MAGLEGHHKRRRRYRHAEFCNSRHAIPDAMDLFVPIPTMSSSSSSSSSGNSTSNSNITNNNSTMDALWSRFVYTGVRHVALTHVVHLGIATTTTQFQLRDPHDRAQVAIPDSLFPTQPPSFQHKITVLRRLHMIVPPTMDDTVAAQIIRSSLLGPPDVLAEYDLVSIAVPAGNNHDAVVAAACSCEDIDIVTLLDTSTTTTTTTMIRPTDVRAIQNRHAVLEIPYARPLLMMIKAGRKVWVQQCRIVMTAAAAAANSGVAEKPVLKIPLIISSGHRSTTTGSSSSSPSTTDVGSVALRTPNDLVNVSRTILGFDHLTAVQAVTTAGRVAMEHGRARRQRQQLQQQPRSSSDPTVTATTTMQVVGINLENRKWRRRVESHGGTPPPPQRNPTDHTTATSTVDVTRPFPHDDNGDDDDFIAL